MSRKILVAGVAALLALLGLPVPALAQVPPGSRLIPVTYTGVVANGQIMLRQPDGSYQPYTGPMPSGALMPGQSVTISFNAVVPTAANFHPAVVAADGIYRFNLATLAISGSGYYPHISDPTFATGDAGPAARITLVYNANLDEFMIEGSGDFTEVVVRQKLVYDGTTGLITDTCGTPQCLVQFTYLGAPNNIIKGDTTSSNLKIGTNVVVDNATGGNVGILNLLINGAWSLPSYSGSATAVPEPSMLAMFGAPSGLLALRRRRRKGAVGAA